MSCLTESLSSVPRVPRSSAHRVRRLPEVAPGAESEGAAQRQRRRRTSVIAQNDTGRFLHRAVSLVATVQSAQWIT